MLVFRSLVVGLLGASCVLLATRPQSHLVFTASPPQLVVVPANVSTMAPPEDVRTAPPVTVIDVAPGASAELLASLIVLAANEHITAIDDVAVRDERVALASLPLRSRQYIDVSIANDVGATRRVLVLPR
jgi:hypothetical protein